MARILVTGGPVHAKLDAVKIITNRFKGGRMAALASALSVRGHEVTYLTSKHTIPPNMLPHTTIVLHDGFIDYMDRIQMLAHQYDMFVLGAAVANLIPEPPWGINEKFPSHNYVEGDIVKIPFRVAPRVINLVKQETPRCTLVGFKLLSGVDDEELIRAAYTIITDSKADLVVANDTENLDRKLLVTCECSVIEMNSETMLNTLDSMAQDKHYTTVWKDNGEQAVSEAMERYVRVVFEHREEIETHGTVEGKVFGCVAVKVERGGFLCSPRGKGSLDATPVYVREVDHGVRHVVVGRVGSDYPKASLNAPLLERIFASNPRTWGIVHVHRTGTGLSVSPYAFPGTVRDTERDIVKDFPGEDFEIAHHGTFTHLLEVS